jgi:Icc-related predicted phosphoesterase
MKDDIELYDIWAKIPDNTNVLITHGPSYGVLDLVTRTYGRDPHVGSKTLAYRKKQLKDLKLHVSGHIHCAYGKVQVNNCLNINPAVLNDSYILVNDPIRTTIC